jgi:hypothetical protein
VWVLVALVDLEMQTDLAPQAALGQHALHSVLNDALRQALWEGGDGGGQGSGKEGQGTGKAKKGKEVSDSACLQLGD